MENTPPPAEKEAPKPRWLAEDLLRGSPEAVIRLGGEEYRLRLTKNHRLILTK